jgi:alpha-D-xyloside xylohydrolase
MREFTGQSPMMPLWVYGYHQSKERCKTQFELLEVVKKYRSLKVPIDGIVQDWQYWGKDSNWNAMSFDPKTYPRPKEMVDSIHQLKAHLFIVSWPGFGPYTKQYNELKERNMSMNYTGCYFKFSKPNAASLSTIGSVFNPSSVNLYSTLGGISG